MLEWVAGGDRADKPLPGLEGVPARQDVAGPAPSTFTTLPAMGATQPCATLLSQADHSEPGNEKCRIWPWAHICIHGGTFQDDP